MDKEQIEEMEGILISRIQKVHTNSPYNPESLQSIALAITALVSLQQSNEG